MFGKNNKTEEKSLSNAKNIEKAVEAEAKAQAEAEREEEAIYELDNTDSTSLLREIVEHYTVVDKRSLQAVEKGIITQEEFLESVKKFLKGRRKNDDVINTTIEAFKKYIWGYHVIDDLIFDKDVSDIKIMNESNVRIKRLGKRESTNIKFASVEDYTSFVKYVATKNKTNISDINAIQTFTDKETNPDFILRFDIMTQFVSSTGLPYMHIRKIPKDKYDMDKLQSLGMFDEKTKKFLIEAAAEAGGILFTGKGASGKTTIMNAMLEQIPHDKSCLVIQENEELFTDKHPEMMFQHIVTSRGEAKIQYTLSDLARNGLLIDLDYFVIGEIKGGEALYFLNAAYTGHKCWASVHGVNSTEAMDKLADYIKYESDYSKADALRMLRGIKYVVFMKDFKVAEISEVVGWDDEKEDLKYKKIL